VTGPPVVRHVDADLAGQPGFTGQAAALLRGLVAGGAALGWVDPPEPAEVAGLLRAVAAAAERGDACLTGAWIGPSLAGLGYWQRYARPTHRPHADIEKVAVAPCYQGRGVGRLLMTELVCSAASAGIEVLTLDFRGDNERAARLYRSLGFTEYGRLPRFVAVGSARYDKVFYARDLRGQGGRPPDRQS
jgi:ribosomal protein S18 acetylase RimI-like enzyme